MIFIDRAEQEIAKTLDSDFFEKIAHRKGAELDYQLARAVFNDYVSKSSELPAEEAFTALDRARLLLEAHLSKLADGYSPLRWLWMLRRIPNHVFSGQFPTTAVYDQALAETLTARSALADSGLKMTNDGICSYSLFGATITRLAAFCAATRYLSTLHASLRWAGKGCKLTLKRDARFVMIPAVALKEAVKLYDQRGSYAAPFQRFGRILGTPSGLPEDPSVLYIHYIEPLLHTLPTELAPETVSDRTRGDEH